MTFWPLLACTLLYFATAVGWWKQGDPAMAVIFFFYGCANGGFLWAALR
jgi:hypothetical protein